MKQLIRIILPLACAVPLTGAALAWQDGKPSPQEVFEDLSDEAQETYDAWVTDIRAKIAAAREAGEELPAIRYAPPYEAFIPRFQEGADAYAGTDGAVPFLLWLAREGMGVDRDTGKRALSTLVDDHLESDAFVPVAPMLTSFIQIFGDEEGAALLSKVEKNAKNKTVVAWAVLARLSDTLGESELGSETYETAKKEMKAAMKGVEDSGLKRQVGQLIEVREKFSIGAVAPDIEGIDLDGTEFKLSDYKGKILFVDFWGDW